MIMRVACIHKEEEANEKKKLNGKQQFIKTHEKKNVHLQKNKNKRASTISRAWNGGNYENMEFRIDSKHAHVLRAQKKDGRRSGWAARNNNGTTHMYACTHIL